MKPSVKKGVIITSVCAVAIGTIVGVKIYMDSTNTIEVNSVASLNTGYWDSPSTSTGFVSNSDTQSIFYDASKTITQIFVSEGQQVSKGDPLLSYDLTTLQSSVDSNQLEVEKTQNAITLAEHELKKLLNTTPIPDATPMPEPTEVPDPKPVPLPSIPEKDENGFSPYILSLSQAEKNIASYKIYYASTDSDDFSENIAPEKGPMDEPSLWQEERISKEYGKACWYWIAYTYTDGSTNAYDAKDAVEYINDSQPIPAEEIDLAGTKKNPYVFKLCEESENADNGIVYGKLFLDNGDQNLYFRFDVYAKNDADEWEVDSSWLVRSDKFASTQSMNEGDMYSVISHTKEEQRYEEIEQEIEQEPEFDPNGYTQVELAKAIRDKKYQLKTLDLDLRKAQLSLNESKQLLSDGIVRAKRNGVVRKVGDVSNPPQDGSAFLEVAGGQGTYIQGTVSELMLDQIKTGDTISGYSWTSGNTITATIDSIDTVPASGNNYYNGSGNPNVSYYGFEAYVEDSTSLQLGEYLELTLSTDAADTTSSIWLSKAYVRQDGNKYYVFKDDHGKLKKQYVTIGKIVWGDTIEIKDGLSDTDYIAFAYSKNAKEGIKTKNSSQEAL